VEVQGKQAYSKERNGAESGGRREVELGAGRGRGRGGRWGPHSVTFAEGGFYVGSRGCSRDKGGEATVRGDERGLGLGLTRGRLGGRGGSVGTAWCHIRR
jgi:hypothetical protein